MADWSVQTMGGFRLSAVGGDAISLGRKGEALLAYLLLTKDQAHSRTRLAGLLWSDRGEEQARHSLRQCILTCRKSLGDAEANILIADGELLRLDRERFDTDIGRFAVLASRDDTDSLREAAVLFKGEVLEGLDLSGEGFEDWLRETRQEYRNMAIAALRRLLDLESKERNTEGIIAAAKRLLEIDALDEVAHRHLMRAYYDTGRRAEALRQYQICADALQRELQAAPEKDTQLLFERIRLNKGPPPREAPEEPRIRGIRIGRRSLILPSGLARRGFLSAAVAVLVALSIGGGLLWLFTGQNFLPHASTPEKVAIAVLPFKPSASTMADKAMAEVLAEGLTEAITTALSVSSHMFVIGSNTAQGYRNKPAKLAAEGMGVRYVLNGLVFGIKGGTIRTVVQLYDSRSNRILWGDQYDRETSDVFSLMNEITMEVVTSLKVQLTEGEQERLAHIHGTKNLKAWIEAGRALKSVRLLTRKDNAIARFHYQQAITLDPDYSTAWAGLAWTHFLDARFGWTADPTASIALSEQTAQKAYQIDTERPRTYALLGILKLIRGDHKKALELGSKSVRLGPNAADARAFLALTYTYTGESEKSISLLKEAMILSPTYPDWYRWCLGRAYRLTGHYLDAESVLSIGLESDSVSIAPRVELVATLMSMRRLGAAWSQAAKIMNQNPQFSVHKWVTVPPYKDSKQEKAEEQLLLDAGLPE